MSETVDNEIRDKVMEKILDKPGNQTCFDCGSKAPKWSSPYLGIVICYECAAKHRSYGTHISFVRSTDLDKWNRKQLKSLELTGNSFTKERFNDLGVPLIGGNYDYNNSMVLKVRQEIQDKVKESLRPDEYRKKESKINNNEIKFDEEIKEVTNNNKKEEKEENNKNKEINNNNKNEEEEKKEKKEKKEKEEKEEKDEMQVPQKFQVDKKAKINNVKVKGKAGKKNKIKKVDFDFDFDSFNDVNFSDFNKPSEEKEDEDKKDEEDSSKKEEKEEVKIKESEGYNKSYDIKLSKKEINKKFANKKAISSEDYAELENNDYNKKEANARIKSMGNSQAISSEDVFGEEGGPSVYEGESMTDKIKEMALNFTLGAAEKAKELKNKTSELINRVQNKFSGNTGY